MSSCYTAAGPKMLVNTAVDESFQIVHFLCIPAVGWMNGTRMLVTL